MNIKNLLDTYLHFHPEEAEKLSMLTNQLNSPKDILSRNNFDGHVTASAFVMTDNGGQILLLDHKSLGKLLQPGGHIETADESLVDATLREIEEETGLKRSDLTLHSAHPNSINIPFDIDTHHIPKNEKKKEPAHYHHDFRFLYTTKNINIAFDPTESNSYKWVDWEDFAEYPNFKNVADKISALIEPNVKSFFRSLITGDSKKVSVIAVSHIIPSSEEYIKSLNENFNLIGIIPKHKSINQSTRKRLEKESIPLLDQFTRESLNSNPNELIKLLKAHDKVCLIDIGGYFSEIIENLKKALGSKLLGIIEDTENGLQKYEANSYKKCIVMSVARSPLKSYEDQLVGHGIAHATETVLRQINLLITYKSCGIIGYGKIGRGIGNYLQQRNIRPRVCEINAMRSIQASCDGATVCSIDELIKECDVIFCATGARALDIVKLRDLKKNAFVSSATSSDDEFDLTLLDTEYDKQVIDPNITNYSKRGHSFNLLNDGNAINFLYSAAVDNYINLVQGELVYSICKLANNTDTKIDTVNNNADHELIAKSWLEYVLQNNTAY